MDCSVEDAVPVINKDVALLICFHHWEEEHVLDVGHRHLTPTLAGQSGRKYADLFAYFGADDGLGLVLILRSVGIGDVRVEPMFEEFLHQCHLAVIAYRGVPNVLPTLSVALSRFPR